MKACVVTYESIDIEDFNTKTIDRYEGIFRIYFEIINII